MERLLEAELLDELPAENPEAVQSRRDLQRVNVFMGHVGIVAKNLLVAFDSKPPRRLLELGAGDGTFFLEVARRLAPRWRHVQVMLVDRQTLVRPETLEQFTARGWSAIAVTDDVFQWLETSAEEFDAVLANLFLHHFSRAHLNILLRGISERTGVFVAAEPRRAAFPLAMSRLLGLLGCNRVTRHDAAASVRAGFAGSELTPIWPADRGWELSERPAGLFSHLFRAKAKAV